MSTPVFMPFTGGYDPAEQLREQDTTAKNFAQTAAKFLNEAYPHVDAGTVWTLRDAFIAWICCGTERQLKAMEQQNSFRSHGPIYGDRDYNSERLVSLVKRRDSLLEQLEQIEVAKADIPVEGMAGMMDAAIAMPIRRELEGVEEEITRLQSDMETLQRANVPEALTVTERGEEPQQQKKEIPCT